MIRCRCGDSHHTSWSVGAGPRAGPEKHNPLFPPLLRGINSTAGPLVSHGRGMPRPYDWLRAGGCNLKLCSINGIEGRGVRPDSRHSLAARKSVTPPGPDVIGATPLQGGLFSLRPWKSA